MKKLLVFFGVLALAAPFLAHGAEIKVNQSYFLNKGETVNQNLYFAGQGANIAGDVNGDVIAVGGVVGVPGNVSGDVVAAGGRVNVLGNVGGSIFAAGGTVEVSGSVANSVRAAGGTLTISGTIGGDLLVGGGQVIVLPDAVIKGDLILGGGNVDIEGKILGNIKSQARRLTINNEVRGTTDLNVENLFLGPKAVLAQGLTYHSYTEAKIDPAAKINGPLNFDKKTTPSVNASAGWGIGALLGAFFFYKLLSLIAIGLIFVYFFKKSSGAIVHESMASWKNLWRGFAFLILTPVLAVLLMATILGIPLGILAFLVYGLVIIISSVFASVAAGAWLQKWIWKMDKFDWKTVLLGVVALMVVGWIPIVGWIASLLLFLSVLGSSVHYFREVFAKEL